uniref:Nudix hydrolase domain-containing protein n=1 Tax=Palpitomonas bilix TaxID=652834 RepID=A0A7S3G9Z2_9EUKA|mmetsp:Transcript_39468/g.101270  ORF Transcript_39468/g.101270 Transcript_39468/m.101270 type:complete len:258 (+) Transcript_39468:86-859(+)
MKHVFKYVSNFVLQEGKLLLLKRSSKKAILPSKWSVSVGTLKEGESVLEGATRELNEELGPLSQNLHLIAAGKSLEVEGSETSTGITHPLLWVRVGRAWQEPALNHEHDDFKWIKLYASDSELDKLDTVMGLQHSAQELIPPPCSLIESTIERPDLALNQQVVTIMKACKTWPELHVSLWRFLDAMEEKKKDLADARKLRNLFRYWLSSMPKRKFQDDVIENSEEYNPLGVLVNDKAFFATRLSCLLGHDIQASELD